MEYHLLECFETVKCNVLVVKLNYRYGNEDIYAIISIHKKEGSINTRFGNKKQMESMVNSYVRKRT